MPTAPTRRAGPVPRRAAPLPPDERRAVIIGAALPLIRKHGSDVTTKQIAEAAGIAEGTLFRAFADKDSLIRAVTESAFDMGPTLIRLASIDRDIDLRLRLSAVVDVVIERLGGVWELMTALRMHGAPLDNPRFVSAGGPTTSNQQLMSAIEELIEPDVASFRVDGRYAARMLRLITFAGTHPRITDESPMSTDEIVSLMLDGLLIKDSRSLTAECARDVSARGHTPGNAEPAHSDNTVPTGETRC